MSTEENKAIVQQYIDAFNVSDFETLESITSAEIFEAAKDGHAWVEATFGDHVLKITQMIAEGDDVAVRLDSSGR
jgi:predicted ester cyclase